jgi:outer membrane protein OmpA-like peptidoglycan-associated protein
MKKIFVIALAALMTAMSANAQFYEGPKQKEKPAANPEEFNPSWFVNFQGGIQLPNTPGMGHLIAPAFSINVGRNIIPLATGRISLEGCNSKVYNEYTGKKRTFKYITGSADGLLNLTNCFEYRERPVNVFLVAGVGVNWSSMPTTNSSKFSPNVRLGGLVDWRLSRNFAINLEYRADNTNDQFNGRLETGTHDWYTSILLGMSLVLPDVKPIIEKDDNSAEIAALNDMINKLRSENMELKNRKPETEVQVKTVEVEKKVVERIAVLPFVFFDCGKTTISKHQSLNVKAIADYMKSNKATKVTVTGYASPEGKPELNQKLSDERAKAVAKMLVEKYGIEADRISTAAGGATCDILPEADLNRVCVSVAK